MLRVVPGATEHLKESLSFLEFLLEFQRHQKPVCSAPVCWAGLLRSCTPAAGALPPLPGAFLQLVLATLCD